LSIPLNILDTIEQEDDSSTDDSCGAQRDIIRRSLDAHIGIPMYDVGLTSPMGYRERRLRTMLLLGSVLRTNPLRR
jgi:hypothetical protein